MLTNTNLSNPSSPSAHSASQESDLRESARHGDTLFPFQRYSTSLHVLSPAFSMHWHPEMEFTKITEGDALYSINLQEYHVAAGDFIFVPPGILHSARIHPQGRMTSDTFVFHLNLLGNSSADICTLRYFTPIADGTLCIPQVISKDTPLYPAVEQFFSRLSAAHAEKAFGYELEVKALLFELLHSLLTRAEGRRTEQSANHIQRLKLIFDYIHTHYAEEISIERIADLCCISPSHFMHFFKEKSGTAFGQYLTQYRLRQSALLLRQNADIAETAYACGFNNLSYFYKRFREYYHMTPREFQKASYLMDSSRSAAPDTAPE